MPKPPDLDALEARLKKHGYAINHIEIDALIERVRRAEADLAFIREHTGMGPNVAPPEQAPRRLHPGGAAMSEPLDLDALWARTESPIEEHFQSPTVAALIERVRRAEADRDAQAANWRSALAKEEALLQKAERMEVVLREIAERRSEYGYHAWRTARDYARAALDPEQAP